MRSSVDWWFQWNDFSTAVINTYKLNLITHPKTQQIITIRTVCRHNNTQNTDPTLAQVFSGWHTGAEPCPRLPPLFTETSSFLSRWPKYGIVINRSLVPHCHAYMSYFAAVVCKNSEYRQNTMLFDSIHKVICKHKQQLNRNVKAHNKNCIETEEVRNHFLASDFYKLTWSDLNIHETQLCMEGWEICIFSIVHNSAIVSHLVGWWRIVVTLHYLRLRLN